MSDLDCLTVGLVTDMFTEKINDSCDYDSEDEIRMATQADFDRF